MNIHELKILPGFFPAVKSGVKTFEVRKNDRGFEVGDKLILREWDPGLKKYTNREVVRTIVYMTDFAQKRGYVVLGISGGAR